MCPQGGATDLCSLGLGRNTQEPSEVCEPPHSAALPGLQVHQDDEGVSCRRGRGVANSSPYVCRNREVFEDAIARGDLCFNYHEAIKVGVLSATPPTEGGGSGTFL